MLNLFQHPIILKLSGLFILSFSGLTRESRIFKELDSPIKSGNDTCWAVTHSLSNPELIKYLRSLNRDIYILIEDGYRDEYLRDVIFDGLPLDDGKIFNLVFSNKRQKGYRLNI